MAGKPYWFAFHFHTVFFFFFFKFFFFLVYWYFLKSHFAQVRRFVPIHIGYKTRLHCSDHMYNGVCLLYKLDTLYSLSSQVTCIISGRQSLKSNLRYKGHLKLGSNLKSFTVCEGELCFYTIHWQFMNEQIKLWVSCAQTYVLFFEKNYCRNFSSGRWILTLLPWVRHTCLF